MNIGSSGGDAVHTTKAVETAASTSTPAACHTGAVSVPRFWSAVLTQKASSTAAYH